VRTSATFKSALVLSLVLTGTSRAPAQSFNQFVGFGDSNIDSGYYRALPSPGGGAAFNALWASAVANGAGKPTSSPGLMNSEALAAYFGLNGLPSNQGGSNYSTSGAKNVTVNTAATGGFQSAIPTVTQISNYLAANGGTANSNALYLINSGANDVSFALGDSGTGPFPANPTAYLIGAANSLAGAIANLQAAGARYIIVPDLYFSFPMGGGAGNAETRQARLDYSLALWSGLAAAGVNFIPADINAVRVAIAANPAAFGFQFVGNGAAQVACTNPGVSSAWALLCSSNPGAPSTFVTPDADQTRLFADDQHLTTAGQKILADYYYSLIVAPSQISFLAEVPVKTRAALVNAILNQISISQRQSGPGGFNAWVTGDVSWLKITNYPGFPDDPGTPVAMTAGFDYRLTRDWLVGAALSVGTTRQTFSLDRGHFTQSAFTASFYAAYLDGPFWANVVGSVGTLQNAVTRSAPIGITVQQNNGDTDGSQISLALQAGYNFIQGPLTHGPLAGVLLQRIHIDGFTESGGFTSLAFDEQKRNSAVTELGYQATFDAGMWRPFIKAAWYHELVSTDRLVTAFLTTITAPGFSLPAVVLGKDWGLANAGATVKISPNVTALVAAYGQFAQDGVVNYGGQVGINVALGAPPAPDMPVKAPRR
jgi:outer membrane lipase/esterase